MIGTTGYEVSKTADGYDLTSDAGETHSVELWGKQAICTCRDFRFRHGPCKHIQASREMAEVTTSAWTI